MLRWIQAISLGTAILATMGVAESCASSGTVYPFWGVAVHGHPVNREMIADAASEMRIAPKIVVFFLTWPVFPGAGEFPESSIEAIRRYGALPCITWEPFTIRDGMEITIPHDRILGGAFDPYITGFAEACTRWGHPLIIRFAHEMNIERYHWGTAKTGYGPESPEIYRKMFRYVVSLFKKAGAGNVLWAFCPNAESVPHTGYDPSAGWNRVPNYYPGDDVVDILGMDGYNWGTTQTVEKNGWQSRWRSFGETFLPVLTELRTLSPGKPVVVFETASATEGGKKSEWINDMIETAGKWHLSGVVWFQANKEIDWRLRSGLPGAMALPRETQPVSIEGWVERLMGRRQGKRPD